MAARSTARAERLRTTRRLEPRKAADVRQPRREHSSGAGMMDATKLGIALLTTAFMAGGAALALAQGGGGAGGGSGGGSAGGGAGGSAGAGSGSGAGALGAG